MSPSWTQNPSEYRDPEIFSRELKTVFHSYPQIVGHAAEIPQAGDYFTLSLGSEPILVTREENGAIRVFLNFCPHRGHPVALEDRGHAPDGFRCRYHGWSFALDGRRRQTLGASSTEKLLEFEGETVNGLIVVKPRSGIAQGEYTQRLARVLEPEVAPSTGFSARSFTHTFDVNWKIYVENMIEGRHIGHVHPEFSTLAESEYQFLTDGEFTKSITPLRREGASTWSAKGYQLALSAARETAGKNSMKFYFFFPSTLLTVYPEQLLLLHAFPITPTRTLVKGCFLHSPEESREVRLARYLNRRIAETIHREDLGVLTRIQANMASENMEARLTVDPVHDPEIAHFHHCLAARLAGNPKPLQ